MSHKDLAKKQLKTPTLFTRSHKRKTFKSVDDKKQGVLNQISQHGAMRHTLCVWPVKFFLRNQKTRVGRNIVSRICHVQN